MSNKKWADEGDQGMWPTEWVENQKRIGHRTQGRVIF